MGMSAGSNDGLFRLAENAAPADDRIMPAERVYATTDKTVDLNSAITLLKQRKKDPSKLIPGGLDDNSEKVRKTSAKKQTNSMNFEAESQKVESISGDFDKKDEPKKAASDKKSTGRYTTGDLMSELFKIQHQVDELLRRPVTKESPKKAEEEKPDYLSELLKGQHRVTFLVNGMEFTVKCLSLVNDPSTHCLVLCFDDHADSFFTPPVQSELSIKYDGEEIAGNLFYFGMNFRLREIGLRFLGFLCDSEH